MKKPLVFSKEMECNIVLDKKTREGYNPSEEDKCFGEGE